MGAAPFALQGTMRFLCALLSMLALRVSAWSPHLARFGISPATQVAATYSPSMGPAKDGPFTPAVLLAKVVLGEPQLLKLRGKAISIHSQEIKKFCADYGVDSKMQQALIKKAKAVGSDLGFLS